MASEEQYGDMFCIVSTVLGVILSVYETPEEQSGLKKNVARAWVNYPFKMPAATTSP